MSRPFGEDDLSALLLDRYWLGEASPEEAAAVEAWFAAHPERKGQYERLRRGLKAGQPIVFSPDDVSRVAMKVLDATGNNRTGDELATKTAYTNFQSAHRFVRFFAHTRLSVIGIGLAMILTVGLAWTWMHERAVGVSEQMYTTGIGQRITVALVDGSRVTLAPQTTVRVMSAFGVSARTVSVRGEAHFDVAAASGIPFIVQTGAVKTQVLGTRFVVKHYDDDSNVQVAVETGKVAIAGTNSTPVVLTAGVVAMANDSGITISDSVDLAPYSNWVNGQLAFKNTPLADALSTLSRWYGVQFRLEDSSLAAAHITGELSYGSLDDMVQVIKNMLAVPLSYQRQDDGSLLIILHATHADAPRHSRGAPLFFPSTLSGR